MPTIKHIALSTRLHIEVFGMKEVGRIDDPGDPRRLPERGREILAGEPGGLVRLEPVDTSQAGATLSGSA